MGLLRLLLLGDFVMGDGGNFDSGAEWRMGGD